MMNELKYRILLCQNIVPVRLRISPPPDLSLCSIFLLCHSSDHQKNSIAFTKLTDWLIQILFTYIIHKNDQPSQYYISAPTKEIINQVSFIKLHNMKCVVTCRLNPSTNAYVNQKQVMKRFICNEIIISNTTLINKNNSSILDHTISNYSIHQLCFSRITGYQTLNIALELMSKARIEK